MAKKRPDSQPPHRGHGSGHTRPSRQPPEPLRAPLIRKKIEEGLSNGSFASPFGDTIQRGLDKQEADRRRAVADANRRRENETRNRESSHATITDSDRQLVLMLIDALDRTTYAIEAHHRLLLDVVNGPTRAETHGNSEGDSAGNHGPDISGTLDLSVAGRGPDTD